LVSMFSIFIVITVIIVAVAIINLRDKKGSKKNNKQMSYVRPGGNTSNPLGNIISNSLKNNGLHAKANRVADSWNPENEPKVSAYERSLKELVKSGLLTQSQMREMVAKAEREKR
jgi:hypothetical protein